MLVLQHYLLFHSLLIHIYGKTLLSIICHVFRSSAISFIWFNIGRFSLLYLMDYIRALRECIYYLSFVISFNTIFIADILAVWMEASLGRAFIPVISTNAAAKPMHFYHLCKLLKSFIYFYLVSAVTTLNSSLIMSNVLFLSLFFIWFLWTFYIWQLCICKF